MGAEWLRTEEHDDGEVAMALGERIREVRKERGWSQAELGEKVGTDSQHISRYENGRITPSVDALVRLAAALDVSTDYLLLDGVPRKVLDGHNLGRLGGRLADLAELSDADQELVSQVIDGLLAKSRLKSLAGGIA
ncbi:MAG TPA: RstR family transcriptional repressor [Acidimicrobiales bacterium]|nr:RstR family transcriptional repressor [Acidimicrobiales bacterium]